MAVLHASGGVSDPATTVLHARHVDSGLAGAMPAPAKRFHVVQATSPPRGTSFMSPIRRVRAAGAPSHAWRPPATSA